eukprot:9474157-Pyramimonas_sp.AAC.1
MPFSPPFPHPSLGCLGLPFERAARRVPAALPVLQGRSGPLRLPPPPQDLVRTDELDPMVRAQEEE